MALVVAAASADTALGVLAARDLASTVIGTVVGTHGGVAIR